MIGPAPELSTLFTNLIIDSETSYSSFSCYDGQGKPLSTLKVAGYLGQW